MTGLPFIEQDEIRLQPACSLGLVLRSRPRPAIREILRSVIARLMSCPPESLRFLESSQGKPYLDGAAIAFNVSHSGANSLIALARHGQIGCDIEDRFGADDVSGLCPLVLHAAELEVIDGLAGAQRQDAFRRYWVRKEAVLKAVGSGFLEDPRRLIVGLDEQHARWASQEGPPFFVHNQLIDVGYPAAVASMDPSCAWYLLDD